MIIVLAILIGLLCGGALFFFLYHTETKSNLEVKQFKKEQKKLLKGLQEKKDIFDKELTQEQLMKQEEIRLALENLDRNYKDTEALYNTKTQQFADKYEEKKTELENSYNLKSKQLENAYNQKRDEINKKDIAAEVARREKLNKDIEVEQQKYNTELQKLSEDYKEKKNSLDTDFFQFSEQISMKRESLQAEIDRYEAQQREVIARFKKDEEVREQQDFYRIKISDIEKTDIEKLKNLALTFSRPEIIYKLLYNVYYKTRIEEMFKRVLGDKKDCGGIYKITNIRNQKVYIGKTSASFLSRWRTHAKRGCNIERIKGQLYDAMWEEGLENFTWEIVEVCPKEEQTEKEKYWIEFYNSSSYGYNQRVG